jgi:hypothetical protein
MSAWNIYYAYGVGIISGMCLQAMFHPLMDILH